MIEVKHLTKKYGTHLAVDDLSFTIEKGRIYGFLGPNGAGKSTTMNIMTGYIGASSITLLYCMIGLLLSQLVGFLRLPYVEAGRLQLAVVLEE